MKPWSGNHVDSTASGDWIFRLEPAPAQKFVPNGKSTNYQLSVATYWPAWGNDLHFGEGNQPLGARAAGCSQGDTYTGLPGDTCGFTCLTGGVAWGCPCDASCQPHFTWSANMEVWRPI
jgi:hypothetical protein